MGLFSLFLLFSNISSPVSIPAASPLILRFFDIGYGDAILLQLPEGGAILIDGGKPEDGGQIAKNIRGLGFDRLESLFITHFHKDHAGGLLPILRGFLSERGDHQEPMDGEIFLPFSPEALEAEVEEEVEAVLDEISQRNYRVIRRGKVWDLSPTVQIEVLHPKDLIGNPNEDSLVLRLIHGAHSFLLGADVGLIAQKELAASFNRLLRSDLIKIPHHANEIFHKGFEDFLALVDPSIAVLTMGPNPYDAPNPEMIAMYEKNVERVLRTDLHGTIVVISDGRTLQVETERR